MESVRRGSTEPYRTLSISAGELAQRLRTVVGRRDEAPRLTDISCRRWWPARSWCGGRTSLKVPASRNRTVTEGGLPVAGDQHAPTREQFGQAPWPPRRHGWTASSPKCPLRRTPTERIDARQAI